jgi:hypothetical protein
LEHDMTAIGAKDAFATWWRARDHVFAFALYIAERIKKQPSCKPAREVGRAPHTRRDIGIEPGEITWL